MNDKATVKAIQLIVNEETISDADKLDIIKRIIEIAHDINVVVNNTKSCDKDGWHLWDAKKEKVDFDFTPEHIKGKEIEVRYANGEQLVPKGIAESFGFSDDYEGYNIAAYRIIS